MLNIFTFEILNAMVTIYHRKIGKATAVSLLGVHTNAQVQVKGNF